MVSSSTRCGTAARSRRRQQAYPMLQGRNSGVLDLQPRINGLALEREHAEHAFVDPPERFALNESLQSLDSERKLAKRKRPLAGQPPLAKASQVLRQRVLRAIDDPEVLASTAFHGGLEQASRTACHE